MPDHTNPHREGGEKSLPGDNGRKLSTIDAPWPVIDPDTSIVDGKRGNFGPKTSCKDDGRPWKPIRDGEHLSPPVDYICPYCNVSVQSTGNFRCYFCGRTAHPSSYTGYGKRYAEHAAEQKRKRENDNFIELCKRRR
jgi:ribosomal protein L37AE/L43A